jgi:hypothetical protein
MGPQRENCVESHISLIPILVGTANTKSNVSQPQAEEDFEAFLKGFSKPCFGVTGWIVQHFLQRMGSALFLEMPPAHANWPFLW